MSERQHYRLSAWLALAGALLLLAGTALHPSQADPRDSPAAFAEYAATSRQAWLTSHLLQLAGLAGLVLAVMLLAWAVRSTRGLVWARVTVAGGAAGLAVAMVVQAVDGVALKAMADQWASAAASDKPALFAATLAVRQIEIGLDALLALALGTMMVAFGLVLCTAARGATALGFCAIILGAVNMVGGILQGLDGYSPAAMLGSTVGGGLAIVWMIAVGIWSWRLAASGAGGMHSDNRIGNASLQQRPSG